MGFIHNWRRFTDINYVIETAPEQEIVDEIRALRAELASLRKAHLEDLRSRADFAENNEVLKSIRETYKTS